MGKSSDRSTAASITDASYLAEHEENGKDFFGKAETIYERR